MRTAVHLPLLFATVVACAAHPKGAQDRGLSDSDAGGSSGGVGGSSTGACPLGTDCIAPCGDLPNYFCGRACDNSPGERSGVNCGRACVGQPDEITGGNCTPPQPDGGAYGRCLEAGEELDAKVIGATCCDGLKRLQRQTNTASGCVDDGGPPSLFICAACGDGSCATYENSCNCPQDCQ